MVGRTPERTARGPASSVSPPTPTWRRCSSGSDRTWSRCACPTRVTSADPAASSEAASRCWWRSRWCSTSTRPTAARRGRGARPVLRDQLQPPLRPADAAGRGGDRGGELGRSRSRPGASGRGGHRQAPVRQPDRDPVPRPGHAGAPVRADRVGDGADDRPDRARARPPWRRAQFASGAVGASSASYDSSYGYPGTHLLEINGLAGRVLIEDTVRGSHLDAAGDETARGVAGRLLQRP